jgi:class 3 adenylate cyclase
VILPDQEAYTQVIRRFEGYLTRYVGDGLLVYFGYPYAHEDNAQHAIWAGLDMVAALPALNSQLQQMVKVLSDFPLQVRISDSHGLGDRGRHGRRRLPRPDGNCD